MSETTRKSEIILYQTEDGKTKLEVRLEHESIWLTQAAMSELFQTTTANINMHIKSIFAEGELSPKGTIKENLIVRKEGRREVKRQVLFYSLQVIIAVGYRVNSTRGTQFRQWATERLNEYLVKGFTLDDDRLKHGMNIGSDYFDEILERIRDIRASEKRFYQKIRDIYKLAVDYDPKTKETLEFFRIIQNKLHFAVSGKTAAELISERVDVSKPNMGLTSWKGLKVRPSDITIAKNYLDAKEMEQLNRIVTMYLDYAEDQARRHRQIFMRDWRQKLDAFLKFKEAPFKNFQEADVSVKITILSENYTIGILGLRAEHGFCALVEKDNRQFLYDTGQLGICVDNAEVLKKDLKKTDKILFSHGHVDHTGGLQRALEAIGRPVEITAHPDIFGKKYTVDKEHGKVYIGMPFEKRNLENKFKASFNLQKGFYNVDEGVWLTGEVPFSNNSEKIPDEFQVEASGGMKKDIFADDNTLVIDTQKGLVAVLGCGHRGVVNILTYIKQKLGKNIYAVIGGMHLNNADRAHIDFVKGSLKRIFKEENTGIFACGHCTGVNIVNEFWPDFKGILSYASCGMTFEF